MNLLDVSFGIYAFMPLGWIFMLCVIAMECVIMARLLPQKWFDKKIYTVTTISNVVSGLTGIILSLELNGGWWLVVWFPWVSNNEIHIANKQAFQGLVGFYLVAFVLTLIIETLINVWLLRKIYPRPAIIKATVISNIVSYAIFSFVLYYYSFNL